MVKMLLRRGFEVTVLDNLQRSSGCGRGRCALRSGDLVERDALDVLCQESRFDGVMHFASYIQVGESVREPAKHYQNNVFKTQCLLDVLVERQVPNFIFFIDGRNLLGSRRTFRSTRRIPSGR